MIFHDRKTSKNQDTADLRKRESGGIIVWILVAIALFAALSFSMSQGLRSGESSISDEKARLLASEILDYAGTVRRAVQQLRINGCADDEISFENSVVSGYNNPSAPADNSCHVFDANGAGLSWTAPPADSLTNPDPTHYARMYIYSGVHCVPSVGTGDDSNCYSDGIVSDSELVITAVGIHDSVCDYINEQNGITVDVFMNDSWGNYYDLAGSDSAKWSGNWDFAGSGNTLHLLLSTDGTNLILGKQIACFYDYTALTNIFYSVLIAQ